MRVVIEKQILMGGYYASAEFSIENSQNISSKDLPYPRILLQGTGEWIWLNKSEPRLKNEPFTRNEIEENFKTMLM